MVALQVVARDSKGLPVSGLTAKDFEVFEQIAPKKELRPQRVAAFQAVSLAASGAAGKSNLQMPSGVYSNLLSTQTQTVPPTILVVDGLNTSVAGQMQVRRQMVKLLGSIPAGIPTAVFLMGRNLHLLQNFTTDPKLLHDAVQKALSLDSTDLAGADSRDDPNALTTLVADVPPPPQPPQGGSQVSAELQQNRAVSAQLQFLQNFERETFSADLNMRVQRTLDAFRSIAQHVAGYPGRKNLLWISSSFPLALFPDSDFKFVGMSEYQDEFVELGKALSDAKIAIYPMDAGGLQAQSFFEASARPTARNAAVGTATSATMMREESSRSANQDSMSQLATETGGRVCVNNNDLADCVKKAVDDGSSYYELSYYPDSGDWDGEFHRIVLKTSRNGVRLATREGYYARGEGGETEKDAAKTSAKLQQAACRDLLTSTAILVLAEPISADQPGQVKYFLGIDPRFITFAPAPEGRSLSLMVAACLLDKDGKALKYLQQPTDMRVSEQQYAALLAQHGFPRTIAFTPSPDTARVRLVVRDMLSGEVGSVDIPYPGHAVVASAPAATTGKDAAVPPAPK
jgi:VWFA-related protein